MGRRIDIYIPWLLWIAKTRERTVDVMENGKDRLKGTVLMIIGVLVISPDTLLISILNADRWTVVFWRSLLTALTLSAVMVVRHGRRTAARMIGIGPGGIVVGALFCVSTIAFVSSVTLTTAANSLVIIAAIPLLAALFSLLFLGERIPARTWSAGAVGLLSIVIIFSGSLGGGALIGDLLALVTAICLAVNFILIRLFRRTSMVPAVILGGVMAALVVLPFSSPLSVQPPDIWPLFVMGMVVLPVPLVLMAIAPMLITAPEVGLILLLETVLGPLWVWLAIGQIPALQTFVGGLILLATLVIHSLFSLRETEHGGTVVN